MFSSLETIIVRCGFRFIITDTCNDVFPCRWLSLRLRERDIVHLCILKGKGKRKNAGMCPEARVVLWMLFVATRAASFVNREKLRARYAFYSRVYVISGRGWRENRAWAKGKWAIGLDRWKKNVCEQTVVKITSYRYLNRAFRYPLSCARYK